MEIIKSYQNSSAQFTSTVNLEDKKCKISFEWNTRVEAFFITVDDNDGGLVSGVKAVENWPLLENHRGFIGLDGQLMILPYVPQPSPLSYDNLGIEWDLVYLTPDEFKDWESAYGYR